MNKSIWDQQRYRLITNHRHALTLFPMTRKPRLDVPGGFYHVLARGNRRATIIHDDVDSRPYLERLEHDRHRDGKNESGSESNF